jgi:molybdate transport system substrate-binding protein
MRSAITLLVIVLGIATCGMAQASQTMVAVAANFTEPAKEIAAAFKTKTGDEAVLSFGSSGQFYAQITQDAPYQILLSADQERPLQLVKAGLADAATRAPYAVGKLVLWSRSAGTVQDGDTLRTARFARLSIANPAAAPYGIAAIETMKALGVYDAVQPKIVQGNSIAQAFQFVETGNAELGFVALSQLAGNVSGSRWLVPSNLYAPILQDAVLLKKGAGNAAAIGFLEFLKGPEARAIIQKFGYDLP